MRESDIPRTSFDGPGRDMQAVWDALVHDAKVFLAVVSRAGTLLFVNGRAARELGASRSSLVGRSLSEFFPDDWFAERLEFINKALETGEPVIVKGMRGGSWTRTTFRAMPGETDESQEQVLIVCRPSSELDPEHRRAGETGVFLAKCQTKGQLDSLTQRELELLRYIGQGFSTAEIAKRLHRSVKTIEWHRVSLGSKLGVSNRVELARIAIQSGLCNLDDTACPA